MGREQRIDALLSYVREKKFVFADDYMPKFCLDYAISPKTFKEYVDLLKKAKLIDSPWYDGRYLTVPRLYAQVTNSILHELERSISSHVRMFGNPPTMNDLNEVVRQDVKKGKESTLLGLCAELDLSQEVALRIINSLTDSLTNQALSSYYYQSGLDRERK